MLCAITRKHAEKAQLGIIKGEIGTREQGENAIKHAKWWGWGAVAHFVISVSWSWVKAGSTAFKKGARWAGCQQMLACAKAGGHGIHLTNVHDPGCPGVVDIYGDASPDHAITFVKDNGDGTCETYEFNTSKDGTYLEGVWRKDRPLRNCWWFKVEC
ncbi:MAG TPA: hypothetical protein VIK32_05810 [Candidatus Limnocylindrales bacterium]